jgi:hypothetical protein
MKEGQVPQIRTVEASWKKKDNCDRMSNERMENHSSAKHMFTEVASVFRHRTIRHSLWESEGKSSSIINLDTSLEL